MGAMAFPVRLVVEFDKATIDEKENMVWIVRRSKTARAAINKYMELLSDLEQAIGSGDARWIRDKLDELRRYDDEVDKMEIKVGSKGVRAGEFRPQVLETHRDWPMVAEKRKDVEAKAAEFVG